ncbi:hypothetical protein GCM10012286_82860 [Streptomyces lasiicapitis]|uniref:Uncharacterized protein n=1 Tax=Streptomyces lasiicapitis TaxID=1923961 RepID=A0ABQ2MWF1_9ACTN|nr:hypothetical protein GCM10012286_82860 [Streptomyces lasiicapitis]
MLNTPRCCRTYPHGTPKTQKKTHSQANPAATDLGVRGRSPLPAAEPPIDAAGRGGIGETPPYANNPRNGNTARRTANTA